METKNKSGDQTKYEGFAVDLMDELKREMGFTYTLKMHNGKYGTKDENGLWTGLVGELVNKVNERWGTYPLTLGVFHPHPPPSPRHLHPRLFRSRLVFFSFRLPLSPSASFTHPPPPHPVIFIPVSFALGSFPCLSASPLCVGKELPPFSPPSRQQRWLTFPDGTGNRGYIYSKIQFCNVHYCARTVKEIPL